MREGENFLKSGDVSEVDTICKLELEKIRKGIEANLVRLSDDPREKEIKLIDWLTERKEVFSPENAALPDEAFKNKLFGEWKKELWGEERKYAKISPPRDAAEQSGLWNLTPAPLRGRIHDGFEIVATDGVGREITIIDRKKDKKLAELCRRAKELRQISNEEKRSFVIAQLVSETMGGSDMAAKSRARSTLVGEKKLLLGEIEHGLCRHRSPLFQVLAIEAELNSTMEGVLAQKGYTSEPHADNPVFLKNSGEIIIVDTTNPPATEKTSGIKFEELSYDEFIASGGFPRWGSNRLPFNLYQSIVLIRSKFDPVGGRFVRFRNGRLGAPGLELFAKEE